MPTSLLEKLSVRQDEKEKKALKHLIVAWTIDTAICRGKSLNVIVTRTVSA